MVLGTAQDKCPDFNISSYYNYKELRMPTQLPAVGSRYPLVK